MSNTIQIDRTSFRNEGTIEKRRMEIMEALHARSSMVKLNLGVLNNTTYYYLLDALNQAETLPEYKHNIKKNFNLVKEAYDRYENKLKHGEGITVGYNVNKAKWFYTPGMKFFDVKYVKKDEFVDGITNEQYFEYWQSLGVGYKKIKRQADAYRNKVIKILHSHGEVNAEAYSWIYLAKAMMHLCGVIFDDIISESFKDIPEIDKNTIRRMFKGFSLEDVEAAYSKAIKTLQSSKEIKIVFTQEEDEEIGFVLQKLEQKMTSEDFLCSTAKCSLRDYRELIRDKKHFDKGLKQIECAIKGAS